MESRFFALALVLDLPCIAVLLNGTRHLLSSISLGKDNDQTSSALPIQVIVRYELFMEHLYIVNVSK